MDGRESVDPYVYKGTGVLANKPGIRDQKALSLFEYEQTQVRAIELAKRPPPKKFDFERLKAIHAHLFQDVFDWAGQTRTVGLSKGGTSFERVQNIEAVGQRISHRLEEQNNLQGLDKRQFVEQVTKLYSDLNALHPFREGNGRSSREFIRELAQGAGYDLDQKRIDFDKGQWNRASAQSIQNDTTALKDILSKAIRPSAAVAFEALPEQDALKKHPELQHTYGALATLKKTLQQRYPDNQKAQDHFLMQARIEAVRKLDQGGIVPGVNQAAQLPSSSVSGDGSTADRRYAIMAAMREQTLKELDALPQLNSGPMKQPVAPSPQNSLAVPASRSFRR